MNNNKQEQKEAGMLDIASTMRDAVASYKHSIFC